MSDFTAESSFSCDSNGFHPGMHAVWNEFQESQRAGRRVKAQCIPHKRGKENALPMPQSTFAVGYPPYFSVPAAPGFWAPHPHFYRGDARDGGTMSGTSNTSHLQRQRQEDPHNRDCPFFNHDARGREFGLAAVSEHSEAGLKRWLSRPAMDDRTDVGSSAVARARSHQITNLTAEGRQAQSTVATHVE